MLAWVLAVVLGMVAVAGPLLAYFLVVLVRDGESAALRSMEDTAIGVDFLFVLNVSLALLIGVALLAVSTWRPNCACSDRVSGST